MKPFPFQITYRGKATLPFSNQNKRDCYFYEINNKKQLPVAIHHHILIIDCEMHQELEKEQLKNCLKKTLASLCKLGKHYVSLLAYKKQEGLVRVLSSVKCDRASYKMAEVERLIAETIEHIGQGPLSQSLKIALEMAERLKDHCDGQHITLFTDGFFDFSAWEEQEAQVCMQLGQCCYEEQITLNIMALGTYYDSHFLKSLIEGHTCSELVHVDQITDYEGTMTALITKVEAISKNTVVIQNENAFLCERHHYYANKGRIEGLNDKKSSLLVTYDAPLELDSQKVKIKKEENLNEVVPCYLYHWSAYLLKNGDIEAAEEAVAETKDLAVYKKICNVYTPREKGTLYKQLIQLAEEPKKRYREGKTIIDREILKREEPLCLLEVLYIILKDESSRLFWDYSYPYERIGPVYQSEEIEYAFIKPTLGYGEIDKICIGSKKLNMGVQVRVRGQVEELKTHLKLDTAVYREYNLMVNGNLNTRYLIAELSKKVRAQLRKQGVIKVVSKQGEKTLYRLQLEKLKVVNNRLIKSITAEQLVKYIYDLEVLKLKENVIKKYLKNHLKNMKSVNKKKVKLYERFHMSEQGIFEMKQDEINHTLPIYTYKAEVVEWKIEKFPKKKLEDELIKDYQLDALKPTSKQIKQLQEQLIEVKKERQTLDYKVQMIRIGSVLMDKPIFKWEYVGERPKKKSVPLTKGNAVVGGKMNVSTVQIEGLVVKQERYTLMVTHQ